MTHPEKSNFPIISISQNEKPVPFDIYFENETGKGFYPTFVESKKSHINHDFKLMK